MSRTVSSRNLSVVAIALVWLLLAVGAAPAHADFGIKPGSLTATAHDDAGTEVAQAGAHPNVTTSFALNTTINSRGLEQPDGSIRDIRVELPPGAIGDPQAGPKCSQALFTPIGTGLPPRCPAGTQVGQFSFHGGLSPGAPIPTPQFASVYNLDPPPGKAAMFGFIYLGNKVVITAEVRSEGDKGVTAVVRDLPAAGNVYDQSLTLWGVPADPVNDLRRCQQPDITAGPTLGTCRADLLPFQHPSSAGITAVPFWTNPSNCGTVPTTRVAIRSWQEPDRWVSAQTTSPAPTGCDRLVFEPQLNVSTTSTAPDSATGLDVDVTIPQNTDPEGLATPPLRKATVTLPEGTSINPSSADGLDACTDAQLQLSSRDAIDCPDAAKIGTVIADTPLLAQPLQGSVYVRSQNSDDPASGEMFRIALVLESKERGLLIKLPGAVRTDPATGRIETVFDNNPQLPVSRIRVSLKGGPRAPLATSGVCGDSTAEGTFSSWGGQAVQRTDVVHVDCPGLAGFAPAFRAGVLTATAGAFSPFVVRVDRPDRQQYVDGLTIQLPTGSLAKLKGVPLCPEAAANAGTCGIGSRVGSATVGAGAGAPFYLEHQPVYLAGPYKGAPYSLSVAARAKAGPFDLGTVVVRQAIRIDPADAHLTVVSDALPTIVKGVPLRIRSIDVSIDRPGFTLNPTSCAEKQIVAVFHSQQGSVSTRTTRFQVGDCRELGLKPKLSLALSGKRQLGDGGHPGLKAVLTQPGGQANLRKVAVKLPLSLALDPDNADSDTLCSFEESRKADPKCPASSIVGSAKAWTPLLNRPVEGPVFFAKNVRIDKKSGRQIRTLPTLVIPLRGEVAVNLIANSDTANDGRLVNTFASVPDAPVSRFELSLKGGKKGILVVNGKACKRSRAAAVAIDGQNGKAADRTVKLAAPCGKAEQASRRSARRR